MKKQMLYADTINGIFDMTWEDVLQTVKENPFFSDSKKVVVVSKDGIAYTGQDLLDAAGVKNQDI